MTHRLAQVAAWLSAGANLLGRIFLAPVGLLPGWVSATAVATVTGVLLLVAFKYTSNQRAIKRARDEIDAHLLALKLFKDSTGVALRAQGRILLGAGRLFLLALVPILVMALPVILLLGQLGLWYQARPLRAGEEAVITLKLSGDASSSWPAVSLRPTHGLEVVAGPVRVESKREVCWNIRARAPGSHRIIFDVGDRTVAKELAVGDGLMRVSTQRPAWDWSAILMYPWEEPFRLDDPVQLIEIAYPERSSWTSGTRSWVVYWFIVSMVAALCFRRALKVNV
jgi:hypothetical protein